jgi:hypothetical protein
MLIRTLLITYTYEITLYSNVQNLWNILYSVSDKEWLRSLDEMILIQKLILHTLINDHTPTKTIYAGTNLSFNIFLNEISKHLIKVGCFTNRTLYLRVILLVFYNSQLCTKYTYVLPSALHRNLRDTRSDIITSIFRTNGQIGRTYFFHFQC